MTSIGKKVVQRMLAVILAISMVATGTVGAYASAAYGLHLRKHDAHSGVLTVRFISPDPLDPTVPTVGTNRYAYAGNDPVNRSDQNGLCPICIGIAIGAMISYFSGVTEANTPETPDDVTHTSETMAMANMAMGAIPGEAVNKLAGVTVGRLAARASVWAMEQPVVRGFIMETKLGANLAPNFRTIDGWNPATGTARSIKSVNLKARTYQDPKKLESTLRSYLRDISNFKGASGLTRDGKPLTITSQSIKKRELEIAIPGKPNKAQQAAIDSVKSEGKTSGVDVKTTVVP